ncbi:hypothetical protein [Usitatibacter palustris]|uniref:Uncharacterized protein n=1 Tax=Usitatibacter palustris TaxID=2732487 RepID=A0A6M4H8A4_9PROT|nr:hypothetical protein [Usitatibacter palustris]QJR15385.1 hypothetical protein DSM104440_02204 [Usitatibacter palustris]
MTSRARTIGTIAGLLLALAGLSFNAAAEFCWKETEPRGAGTIPTGCGSGKENNAGLCYSGCPSGYGQAGPVCWKNCPAGYSDHGVGCTKPAPYGRGTGYAWKITDGTSSSGMLSRCGKDHSQGCEMNGAMAYPKCASGFKNVGCCICSPSCPSGFTDTGATCTKPTQTRGAGTIPTACDSGKENTAGLCYNECKWKGSAGWGPVCWRQCPKSAPVECGLGCAANLPECAAAMLEQTMSVMDLVITIAMEVQTGGASFAFKSMTSGGKTAFIAAAKAMIKSKAVKMVNRQEVVKVLKSQFKSASESQIENMANAATGQDFDFYSLDPTGIAPIVKAYNKKICKT